MAISSVSDIYKKLVSSITSNTTRVVDNTRVSNSRNTGNNSMTDTLELNSSASDLAAYLNYSSTGNYSSLSLTDYLDSESDDKDNSLLDFLETGSTDELLSFDGSTGSSDSISSLFEELADAKSKENDELISKALNKYANASSKSSDDNLDEDK